MAKKKNSGKARAKKTSQNAAANQPHKTTATSNPPVTTSRNSQKSTKITTEHLPLPEGIKRPSEQKKAKKCRQKNAKRRGKMSRSYIAANHWANPPNEDKELRPVEVQFILSRLDDGQKHLDNRDAGFNDYLTEIFGLTRDEYIIKYLIPKYQRTLLLEKNVYFRHLFDIDEVLDCPAEDDEEVQKRLMLWPDVPTITLAPLSLTHKGHEEGSIRNPKVQSSSFLKVLRMPEIGENIIEGLSHQGLKNVILSCSEAHNAVSNLVDIWDLTHGGFNGCEVIEHNEEVWACPPKPQQISADRGVGHSLVVSPFRTPWVGEIGTKRGNLHYGSQLGLTVDILQSIFNFGWNLRVLHLHRVPFFNLDVFNLLLKGETDPLPNLVRLGVYRCELLHFGDTIKLLEALKIRKKQYARKIDAFDFYPRYHDGPIKEGRRGSYGITWGDSGVDTPRAVACALFWRILPAAAELGFDFTTEDSSFRQFLEKLPLPDFFVPYLLAMADLWKCIGPVRPRDLPQRLLKDLYALIEHQIIDDEEGFVGDWRKCTACQYEVPWYFLPKADTRCASCVLSSHLDSEWDHYKLNKQFIINVLLRRRVRDDPEDDWARRNNLEERNTRKLRSLDEFIESEAWEPTECGDDPLGLFAAGRDDAIKLVAWLNKTRSLHCKGQRATPPPFNYEKSDYINPWRGAAVPYDSPWCPQQANDFDPNRPVAQHVIDNSYIDAALGSWRYEAPHNLDVMRANFHKGLTEFKAKKEALKKPRELYTNKHLEGLPQDLTSLAQSMTAPKTQQAITGYDWTSQSTGWDTPSNTQDALRTAWDASPRSSGEASGSGWGTSTGWGAETSASSSSDNVADKPPTPEASHTPPVAQENREDFVDKPTTTETPQAASDPQEKQHTTGRGNNGGNGRRKNWRRNRNGKNKNGQNQQNSEGQGNDENTDKSGGQQGDTTRINQGKQNQQDTTPTLVPGQTVTDSPESSKPIRSFADVAKAKPASSGQPRSQNKRNNPRKSDTTKKHEPHGSADIAYKSNTSNPSGQARGNAFGVSDDVRNWLTQDKPTNNGSRPSSNKK